MGEWSSVLAKRTVGETSCYCEYIGFTYISRTDCYRCLCVCVYSNVDQYGFERPPDFDYKTYDEFMSRYVSVLTRRAGRWATLMNGKEELSVSQKCMQSFIPFISFRNNVTLFYLHFFVKYFLILHIQGRISIVQKQNHLLKLYNMQTNLVFGNIVVLRRIIHGHTLSHVVMDSCINCLLSMRILLLRVNARKII